MPQPIRASDVPLREQGPSLVTRIVARIELHSADEFVEAEKLVALRDLIEERVQSVEFEIERDWMKPKPTTRRGARREGGGQQLREATEKHVAGLKKGDVVSREDLCAVSGGTWRQLAPIVRALVKRGVLVDKGDGKFERTGTAM